MVVTVLDAVIGHGSGFIGRLQDYPMDLTTQEVEDVNVGGGGGGGGGISGGASSERKKRKKDDALVASGNNAISSNQPSSSSSSSWTNAVHALIQICVQVAGMLDDVDTLHKNNQLTVAPSSSSSSSSSRRAASDVSSSSFPAALHLAKHRLWLLHAAVVVLPLSPSSTSSSSSPHSRSQSTHPINMDVTMTCHWLSLAAGALSSRYKGSRVTGGGSSTTNDRLDRETNTTHHSLEVIVTLTQLNLTGTLFLPHAKNTPTPTHPTHTPHNPLINPPPCQPTLPTHLIRLSPSPGVVSPS